MPGIPLLNLGTALGGLAGGWNQARSQGLQQAIQQLALQQQQGLTNQQTLAGLALQAGLLNQPGGGQTPLGAATGAVPNQSSTPTPSPSGGGPQVSPSSGMPMPQGYTYTPPGPMSPYGPPGDSSQSAPSDTGDLSPAGQVMHNPKVLASWQDASGGSGYVLPGGPVQPSSQTASSGGSDATPTPPMQMQTQPTIPTLTQQGGDQQSSDSGQQPGGGTQQLQYVLPNGQTIDMPGLFQRVDYQKLAQGIAALAPPGTSQADIYGAVVDLAKLGEGDKYQQQAAASIMKTLIGGNFRMAEINQQGTNQANVANIRGGYQTNIAQGREQTQTNIAQMNNATRMAIANQSAQLKQAGMQARNAVQWTQIAQKNQQLAQQLNIAGQREAAQAISQQLRALQARIATFKPGPDGNFTDDQQKQLQAINDQIASIGAKVGAQQGAGP